MSQFIYSDHLWNKRLPSHLEGPHACSTAVACAALGALKGIGSFGEEETAFNLYRFYETARERLLCLTSSVTSIWDQNKQGRGEFQMQLCEWTGRRLNGVNVLLSADVLVRLRVACHLPDAHSIFDVLKLQTQVLTGDGQHSASLSGPRFWNKLVERQTNVGIKKEVWRN